MTPHNHITNLSEQVVHTFKEHFKAGLGSIDPYLPIRKCGRIVEQGELALNLLRASRSNLKLSTYAYLFRQFDYSVTPLVPLETKALVHLKLSVRTAYEINGEEDCTIGP